MQTLHAIHQKVKANASRYPTEPIVGDPINVHADLKEEYDRLSAELTEVKQRMREERKQYHASPPHYIAHSLILILL